MYHTNEALLATARWYDRYPLPKESISQLDPHTPQQIDGSGTLADGIIHRVSSGCGEEFHSWTGAEMGAGAGGARRGGGQARQVAIGQSNSKIIYSATMTCATIIT